MLSPAGTMAADLTFRASTRGKARRWFIPLGLGLGVAAANLWALPYYAAPIEERLRHPLRALFKPSGTVGQSLGFAALACFLFLWLYPLRKRYRALAFTGAIGRWLDVHIVAGALTPVLAAMHASWRFQGLIGLGYGAMLVTALSGLVGRYLYSWLPRGHEGRVLDREQVAHERRKLLGEICEATGLSPLAAERALAARPPPRAGVLGTLRAMLAADLDRHLAVRRFVRALTHHAQGRTLDRGTVRRIARLARREIALDQQARLLEAAQRIFGLWHVAHRPMAIMALLAVLVHVGVAVALGQTWVR